MLRRNLANADFVVIVAEYVSLGGDRAGYSPICPANADAYMGITASAQYAYEDVLAHEVGHGLCATHEMGFALNFGAFITDCEQRHAIMGGSQPFPIPTASWWSPAVLSGAPFGQGGGPDSPFSNMTSQCPVASTGAYAFTCTQTGACAVNQSGDAAQCPFYMSFSHVAVIGPKSTP
jgi:hypothetical protein